jgi:hypothetical protein
MTYQRNETPEPLAEPGRAGGPDATTYLLAAEYWHPEVMEPWCVPELRIAAESTCDAYAIEIAFAEIYDEQDARCWYYLLLAAAAGAAS